MDALYYRQNELDIERTGTEVTVPTNDVAHLMYYLNCVCITIDCNNDADIRRFTNYKNWASLSFNEQKLLVDLCEALSPDVFEDRVFFHAEELCVQCSNEFYSINQMQHQFLIAESVMIAGRTRQVNKIMVYQMEWMRQYYIYPMQRLKRRFTAVVQPPPRPVSYVTPLLYQPVIPPVPNNSCYRPGRTLCFILTCIIVIVIIIGVIIRLLS